LYYWWLDLGREQDTPHQSHSYSPALKLNRQQTDHAGPLISEGKRREEIAGLFKVSRSTLY
jgi:hypothetical protein